MPRLVVVSIPGHNNSCGGVLASLGIDFEIVAHHSEVMFCSRSGETGSMPAHRNDVCLGVKDPNDSYLQPGPLFRQGLRIQLVDLVRSLEYESSATLFTQ